MTKVIATFSEHHRHTVCFEGNIDVAGFVLIHMPVETWQAMGEPKSIIVNYGPQKAKELTVGVSDTIAKSV